MPVESSHQVRLAFGDGHSPHRRDQALETRALKAERVVNDSRSVAKWNVLMTDVSSERVVDQTAMPRNDASIAASVLSVSANVAETVMETESGTGSTVSANGTLIEIETDAIARSGTEIGNETATETANEVTGIDGTKRIAIEKAGRTVKLTLEVGLFSPLRTVVSPLGQVIVRQRPLRTSWGSEEDLLMMTCVSSLQSSLLYSLRPHVCLTVRPCVQAQHP